MDTIELAHGYALEVGTALQVRIEDLEFMFASELIGAEDDGHLLIAFDSEMEIFQNRLKTGMIISVYYLADDIYHMFNTRFERLADDPVKALALQAPGEVLNIERRSHRRINCTLPARVDIRKTLSMEISNINHKGCRITSDANAAAAIRLEPSDRILLRIRAPEAPHGYIVEGQIRNVIRQGDRFEAGVLFDTLPETFKTFLKSLTITDE
ncbi:MAG: PilZ domain-containing protein [Desulfosarcina sp.]|nr:PilZ domain-containing protein [Desulfobacterales bacterium]